MIFHLYSDGNFIHLGGMMLSDFKTEVETFLAETEVSASGLGRAALGDPNFVANLRAGMEPREKTRSKVLRKMSALRSQGHQQ